MQTVFQYSEYEHDEALDATFFLFSYNQERFIEASCLAALSQKNCRLEIILSDDCSSDKTFSIMERIAESYFGPHKIILNRNDHNLGLTSHVNLCFEISSCDFIIIAAGDDISEPDRASALIRKRLSIASKPLLFHSSVCKIDEFGKCLGIWQPPLVTNPRSLKDLSVSFELYIGASGAWDRRLFDLFGPIVEAKAWEDQVLGFRAALKESICYIDEPLVRYRVSVGISSKTLKTSLRFKERIETALSIIDRKSSVLRQRRNDLALLPEAEANILPILDKHIARTLMAERFYRQTGTFFLNAMGNPSVAFRVAYDELKYLTSVRARLKFLMGSLFDKRRTGRRSV